MVAFPAVLVCEYLLYLPAVCFFGFRLKALLGFCITTRVKLCKHNCLFALHLEGQNSIICSTNACFDRGGIGMYSEREFTELGSKYHHCQKVHHPA